jgi:hypothetical protein
MLGWEGEAGHLVLASTPSALRPAASDGPGGTAPRMTAGQLGATSVPTLVRADFGVDVQTTSRRFDEDGWYLQGTSDLVCTVCTTDEPLIVYRRPYTTTKGAYEYWGIVCICCRIVRAWVDYDAATQRLLKRWQDERVLDTVEPAAAEEEPEADAVPPAAVAVAMSLGASVAGVVPLPKAPPAANRVGVASSSVQAVLGDMVEAAMLEYQAAIATRRTVDVGPARRTEGDATVAVFEVRVPAIDLSEHPEGSLFLAASSSDATQIPARLVSASRSEAVVQALEAVSDVTNLRLFSVIDPGAIAAAFHRYLSTTNELGCAGQYVARGPLRVGVAFASADLNDEQNVAVGAILEPGLAAVWGPPGTGKTRVIGCAVAEILRRGQTVALVSNTNVAVDQALLHISREIRNMEVGQVVRVGHPSIRAIADHPHLTVAKVAEVKNRELAGNIAALHALIEAATADPDLKALSALDELLAGRDVVALSALVARESDLSRLPQARSVDERLRAVTASCAERHAAAGTAYDSARERSARVADYTWVLETDREVASLVRAIAVSDTASSAVADHLAQLDQVPLFKRRSVRKVLNGQQSSLEAQRASHAADLARAQAQLNVASAAGATPSEVRSAQAGLEAAEREWTAARTELERAQHDAAAAEADLASLSSIEPLTDTEQELLAYVRRAGSVQLVVDERLNLAAAVAVLNGKVGVWTSEVAKLIAQMQGLESTVVHEARVVGTTLAQLVLHRALQSRSFDHVVIDEASAALVPYVTAALTKAKVGATLVGDFEQNSPISRCRRENVPASMKELLFEHPFARLGIVDAGSACATSGCVVLRDQYRFGEATMQLANAISYGGLIRHGRLPSIDTESEFTLIDTSKLGDAGRSLRGHDGSGRWWLAGAELSLALAKRHGFDDIGVVTPYKHQARLIRSRLNDGGGQTAEVGTAHAFQGREFPVMIVDSVEDGSGVSWVAKAHRQAGPWALDGVRLFNVAVTRNAGRLYLIANIGAIHAARKGPLVEVRRLLERRLVDVEDARELLDHLPAAGQSFLTVDAVDAAPLPHPVQDFSVLLDDREFYAEFHAAVGSATKRVVIFSPFVTSNRLDQILPDLSAAAARGVVVSALTKDAAALRDPRLLDRLRCAGVYVTERPGMHEKIVIIDDQLSYIGSLNVLSNNGKSGEVMMRLDGVETTTRLTQWMRQIAKRS